MKKVSAMRFFEHWNGSWMWWGWFVQETPCNDAVVGRFVVVAKKFISYYLAICGSDTTYRNATFIQQSFDLTETTDFSILVKVPIGFFHFFAYLILGSLPDLSKNGFSHFTKIKENYPKKYIYPV